MEHVHELFRPPFLDLCNALRAERRRFLLTSEAKALALRCGFEEDNWTMGLRVAEQVSFFSVSLLFPLRSANHSAPAPISFTVDDHLRAPRDVLLPGGAV